MSKTPSSKDALSVADLNLEYTYLAKGKYWRFRRNGRDTKIKGEPGSREFFTHYNALMEQETGRTASTGPEKGSFNWLIKRYEKSAEFRALQDVTQKDYSRTLRVLEADLGAQPYAYITRKMVKAVRDDYADTARKAHKIKQMVSRLYSWAQEEDLVPQDYNPAATIKKLTRKGGTREITVWSDEEIELFLQHCPDRLITPIMLALYTGQRSSDVMAMTWTNWQGNIIRVRQSKTRAMLDLPCHPKLQARLQLEKARREGLLICVRNPATKDTPTEHWHDNTFGAALYRAVMTTPDMPANRSMHGLRYAAASRMEEAGSTVAEIEAVLGHRTFQMALKYATQRLRAKAGIDRLQA